MDTREIAPVVYQHFGGSGVTAIPNRRIGAKKRLKTDPWAFDDQQVRSLIERVFPNVQTDATEHKRALVWLRIIGLYFRGDDGNVFSAAQIASTIGMSMKQVEDTVCRMRRAARGLRTDKRVSTGRRRGRPRKM